MNKVTIEITRNGYTVSVVLGGAQEITEKHNLTPIGAESEGPLLADNDDIPEDLSENIRDAMFNINDIARILEDIYWEEK